MCIPYHGRLFRACDGTDAGTQREQTERHAAPRWRHLGRVRVRWLGGRVRVRVGVRVRVRVGVGVGVRVRANPNQLCAADRVIRLALVRAPRDHTWV